MKLLLIKIVLTAIAFMFVFPAIPGITFHGGIWTALLLSLLFGILLWIIDLIAISISAVIAITSFGLALLWLIPLWILGFWMLPAATLKLLAHLLPTHLTIHGWLPAILGGLIMLCIGVCSSATAKHCCNQKT